MNQATFIALSDFHNWFTQGRVQLAGLPIESVTPLYDSVQDLRSRARQLAYGCISIRRRVLILSLSGKSPIQIGAA
jgi:hypothetical protein